MKKERGEALCGDAGRRRLGGACVTEKEKKKSWRDLLANWSPHPYQPERRNKEAHFPSISRLVVAVKGASETQGVTREGRD